MVDKDQIIDLDDKKKGSVWLPW